MATRATVACLISFSPLSICQWRSLPQQEKQLACGAPEQQGDRQSGAPEAGNASRDLHCALPSHSNYWQQDAGSRQLPSRSDPQWLGSNHNGHFMSILCYVTARRKLYYESYTMLLRSPYAWQVQVLHDCLPSICNMRERDGALLFPRRSRVAERSSYCLPPTRRIGRLLFREV